MSDLEELNRKLAHSDPGDSQERLAQMASAWKVDAEAEKARIDGNVAQRSARTEAVRFWVPIMAPTVTAAALVATLVFQVVQSRDAAAASRRQLQQTEWRETLSRFKDESPGSTALGVFGLASFLDSEEFGPFARQAMAFAMVRIPDPQYFERALSELMKRTDWENIDDVTHLSRALHLVRDRAREHGDTKTAALLDESIVALGKTIAERFRMSGSTRRGTRAVDLRYFEFAHCDLKGAAFGSARFSNGIMYLTDVTDADLGALADFEDSDWEGTAWWRAKRVHPALLEYLLQHFPRKDSVEFAPAAGSDEDYRRAIKRLKG